ncbi:hypothetical protein [Rhodopseudomonas palustris]|uniref:hypothetical protein n=1 Tax=Rhodopseudomonas palustris TaxID=1076 RepID=UPI001F38EDF1|nr:hypothetical protein [Rhodopseudomonas palustris]
MSELSFVVPEVATVACCVCVWVRAGVAVRRVARPALDPSWRRGLDEFADSTRTSGKTWRVRCVAASAVCARASTPEPAVIAQASAMLKPHVDASNARLLESSVNAL